MDRTPQPVLLEQCHCSSWRASAGVCFAGSPRVRGYVTARCRRGTSRLTVFTVPLKSWQSSYSSNLHRRTKKGRHGRADGHKMRGTRARVQGQICSMCGAVFSFASAATLSPRLSKTCSAGFCFPSAATLSSRKHGSIVVLSLQEQAASLLSYQTCGAQPRRQHPLWTVRAG